MSQTNTQFLLAKRPVGEPGADCWTLTKSAMPEPGEGEFLVKNEYISLDPAMRGWMNDSKSYIPPVGIGEVMRACSAGEVVASNNPKFNVGDKVSGIFGVQEYAISNGKGAAVVDANLLPLPMYLAALGMPGMTGYFGLLEVGQPQEGDTVVVSGASGAVGQVVGQVAKIKGCRVVGIAGGPEKCAYVVDELGFDACIDYKAENVKAKLKEHYPKGVNVYFDNVGGEILDDVLTQIAPKARIVICGAISQYNNTTPIKGPSNYLSLLVNRARMEGIVVMDYTHQYREGAMQMGQWMMQGKFKCKIDTVEGLETFPNTLMKLFTGENFGKLVIKV